jgi:hypothetical protein
VESYGCSWIWNDDDDDKNEIDEPTGNLEKQAEVGGRERHRDERRLAPYKAPSLWSSVLFSPQTCCGAGDAGGTIHIDDDDDDDTDTYNE